MLPMDPPSLYLRLYQLPQPLQILLLLLGALSSHGVVANFGTPLRVCSIVSQSRIARYRASKTACSESDWEDSLKALLLADNPIGGVQATARIADDQEKPTGDARGYMFIDIRKKVSGNAVCYRCSRRPNAPPATTWTLK